MSIGAKKALGAAIKMKYLKYACAVLLSTAAPNLHAYEPPPPENFIPIGSEYYLAFSDRAPYKLVVDDQVTGGCLPNPDRLAHKAELSLRKNKYNISDSSGATISISALGYKSSDGSCIVHIRSFIRLPVNVLLWHGSGLWTGAYLKHEISGQILSGPRYDMQERLETFAEDIGDELFLQVERAKDGVERFVSTEDAGS